MNYWPLSGWFRTMIFLWASRTFAFVLFGLCKQNKNRAFRKGYVAILWPLCVVVSISNMLLRPKLGLFCFTVPTWYVCLTDNLTLLFISRITAMQSIWNWFILVTVVLFCLMFYFKVLFIAWRQIFLALNLHTVLLDR